VRVRGEALKSGRKREEVKKRPFRDKQTKVVRTIRGNGKGAARLLGPKNERKNPRKQDS